MKAMKRIISFLLVLFLSFGVVPSWMESIETVHAVAPDYTVSNSYKNGPYYQKLLAVTLENNEALNLVKVAKSQVGYHCGKDINDLSGTSTAHKDYKWTEYQYRVDKGSKGLDWCAYFVSWCARQARIPTSLIPQTSRATLMHEGVPGYKDITSGYEPKAGDLFFLEPYDKLKQTRYIAARNSDGVPVLSGHVGIVTAYDKTTKTMSFVDGNVSGKVRSDSWVIKHVRGASNNWLQGFLAVDYDGTEFGWEDMIDQIKINVNTTGVDSITTTNAIVRGTVTKPSAATRISTIGLYLGTSSSNLTKRNTESVSDGANNKDNGMGFDVWYNLTSELGIVLKPNTTYYYQMYATYGGIEYKGEILSFTTKGTTQIYERKANVTVPANYGVIQCYQTVDSTTNYRKINASTRAYIIYATKYADLSNGKRRFYWTDDSGYSMWFDYDSKFTVGYASTSISVSETNVVVEAGEPYYIFTERYPTDSNEVLYLGLDDQWFVSWVSNANMYLHKDDSQKMIEIYGYLPSTGVGYIKGSSSGIKTYFNIEVRDTTAPADFCSQILSQSDDTFAACCSPTDFVGVTDVGVELLINNELVMPLTWASEGASLVNENGDWYYYVNASDFGNKNGKYTLVFYAKDAAGNISHEGVSVDIKPEQIDNVYASGMQNGITVTWSEMQDVDGYVVYRKEVNEEWVEIGKTSTNFFVDESAFAGVTYYYAVSGYQSYESVYDEVELDFVIGDQGEFSTGVSFEKPIEPVVPNNPTKKPLSIGSQVKNGALLYKVTSSSSIRPTVAVCGVVNKATKKVIIPDSIIYNGIKYYVTSISANAFKNNKSIKQIYIGTNIENIGKKAFYNCKKLKKVYLFTTKLADKVGKKAFKNCSSSTKVYIKKAKFKAYKKVLLKAGISKKAKFIRK